MHFLLVSAIWGTLKFHSAKSTSATNLNNDEKKWTFGQILPVFLLLGPIVTTAQIIFEPENKDSSPPTSASNETGTYRSLEDTNVAQHTSSGSVEDGNVAQNTSGESLEDGNGIQNTSNESGESLEMRPFSQHVDNCLDRNYYDSKTHRWIFGAAVLPYFGMLVLSIMILINFFAATKVIAILKSWIVPFVILYPTTTFLYVFANIVYENISPSRRYRFLYWVVMIIAYFSYAIIPGFRDRSSREVISLSSPVDIFIISAASTIGCISGFGLSILLLLFREEP